MTFKRKQRLKKQRSPLLADLLYLLRKLLLIAVVLASLYVFLFGLVRYQGTDMKPAIKDGDLVAYYRLDKSYQVGDLLAYGYKSKTYIGRVVASGGDVVDITDKGLLVNGSLQQENNIYTDTLLYEEGLSFPITVPKEHVFVLGDNREQALDSRVVGAIPSQKTYGKVVMLMRRRNF